PRVHERRSLPVRCVPKHRRRDSRARRKRERIRMQPFEYIRADEADAAIALVGRDPDAQYLAGGTTQLDLMLKDGVLEPGRLVDITRLPLRAITRDDGALHVGALTTMEELAADATVAERPRQS